MLQPPDFLYFNCSVPDVFNSVKKCNKRLCFSRVIILRFRAEFGFFRDLPTAKVKEEEEHILNRVIEMLIKMTGESNQ